MKFKRIIHYSKLIILHLYYKIIYFNKDINIGFGTQIARSARLRTNMGGGITIGGRCEIGEGVIIETFGGIISIGNNSSINHYCILYGHGGLEIGSDVRMGARCTVIPANHKFRKREIKFMDQGLTCKGIKIHNDVWFGTGVIVLDGVTIGGQSVVAAGAVVTSNIPKGSLVKGVPAKDEKIKWRK